MAKRPAWSRWCRRNMRGETVEWLGENWTVLTHVKNGVWAVIKGRERLYLKLNRNGSVSNRQFERQTTQRTKRKKSPSWALERRWPVGTKFSVKFPQGVATGWQIGGYTPSGVYYYKPEYDGDNRKARRSSREDFEMDVINRIIVKE